MSIETWRQQQGALQGRVRAAQVLYVFLDPDGTQGAVLGVVLERPTGVVYGHQCAGMLCEERLVEGAFVPLGGYGADGEERAQISGLTACFHEKRACRWGYAREMPESVLGQLARAVSQIAYWHNDFEDDNKTTRAPLELDRNRMSEIAEGWVPVLTADGPGVLVFDNCD